MTRSAPRLSLIVAASENDVIGRGGDLPWRLSADLQRFKRLTMGHAIIMGRKTWESIGRPLPGRTSIVLSRQADWFLEDALIASDLDSAVEAASRATCDQEEIFVIGGAAVFEEALPRAGCLFLTRVHAVLEGDTVLPTIDWSQWQLVEESRHAADARNEYAQTFQVWYRRE